MLKALFSVAKQTTQSITLRKHGNFCFHSLSRVSICLLSVTKNHPTIQKIIDGLHTNNIEGLLTEIGGLNDKNREIALKLVLKDIYSHKIQTATISNPKFINQAVKSPQIYLDSLLFKIKELIRRLNDTLQKQDQQAMKIILNQLNDTFVLCFNIFKQIPLQHQRKHQILLNKRFADYNLMYLTNIIDPKQKKEVLIKCREFYRRTIILMDSLIREEIQKLNKSQQKNDNQDQSPDDIKLRQSSMNQNIRMLIETNSQNILHLFRTINELHNRKINEQEFNDGIMEMLSNFQRAIVWYKTISGISTHSIFYHRIKKIRSELNNYYKHTIQRKKEGSKIDDAKLEQEFVKEQQELYEEAQKDLEKISHEDRYIGNMEELSLLLLSLRINQIKKQKLNKQNFKEKLFQVVKNILDIIASPTNRKTVSSKLGKAIKPLLQNIEKQQIK